MADFGGLKFDVSDEPIVRTVGRKKNPVPENIKSAVATAIKTKKVAVVNLETKKVPNLRRLLKQAVQEAGNFTLKTQEVPDDNGNSVFRFSVEPKASE